MRTEGSYTPVFLVQEGSRPSTPKTGPSQSPLLTGGQGVRGVGEGGRVKDVSTDKTVSPSGVAQGGPKRSQRQDRQPSPSPPGPTSSVGEGTTAVDKEIGLVLSGEVRVGTGSSRRRTESHGFSGFHGEVFRKGKTERTPVLPRPRRNLSSVSVGTGLGRTRSSGSVNEIRSPPPPLSTGPRPRSGNRH